MFSLLPTSIQLLLSSLLWKSHPSPPSQLSFQLRHAHAITNDERIIFADAAASLDDNLYSINTIPITVHRPESLSAFTAARRRSSQRQKTDSSLWNEDEIVGPDTQSRETLLLLAKMASNSYFSPGDKGWYDLPSPFNNTNNTSPYGWEPDADGFRGHIFVSSDNSTVVLSIKGTSLPWIHGGPTTKKDKLNDNLLFSCCCARVGPTWSTVCGCYQGGWSGGYKCDIGCLQQSLVEESLFYNVGINLYNNITYLYPESNIWVIGHSLGGSLASLLGITFGVPVVAFEAPGEQMASRRLHLPMPPTVEHVTHVFNTADPIAMGTCNGISSTCANAGYAMESRCHNGKIVKYDTVGKWKWTSNVQNHGIGVVVDNILAVEEDWGNSANGEGEGKDVGLFGWWGGGNKGGKDGEGKGREVPEAVDEDADCAATECISWTFGEFRNASGTIIVM